MRLAPWPFAPPGSHRNTTRFQPHAFSCSRIDSGKALIDGAQKASITMPETTTVQVDGKPIGTVNRASGGTGGGGKAAGRANQVTQSDSNKESNSEGLTVVEAAPTKVADICLLIRTLVALFKNVQALGPYVDWSTEATAKADALTSCKSQANRIYDECQKALNEKKLRDATAELNNEDLSSLRDNANELLTAGLVSLANVDETLRAVAGAVDRVAPEEEED